MCVSFPFLKKIKYNHLLSHNKAITKGRMAKGWNQEELARLVHKPLSTIKECEIPTSRKPDSIVLGKLEKELEIHLQGMWFYFASKLRQADIV